MANKPKFDPNSAFKNIVGIAEEVIEEKTIEIKTQDVLLEKDIEVQTVTSLINIKENTSEGEQVPKVKLVQKAYYITNEQHKALKIKSAMEGLDMSTIVREALERYLG